MLVTYKVCFIYLDGYVGTQGAPKIVDLFRDIFDGFLLVSFQFIGLYLKNIRLGNQQKLKIRNLDVIVFKISGPTSIMSSSSLLTR